LRGHRSPSGHLAGALEKHFFWISMYSSHGGALTVFPGSLSLFLRNTVYGTPKSGSIVGSPSPPVIY